MSGSRNGSIANHSMVPRTLPYGDQHGSFRGVAACSNRDDGFFSGENNYVNHILFTGYRYQCVEYARRFLLLTTGCVFGPCGRASEIYKMDHVTHVETGKRYPFIPHDNGTTTTRPEAGDIIIYPYHEEQTPWGHIGVISCVDDTRVGIAEQNQFFGPFVSPSPDYLDGERCVGRFVDLLQDPSTGAWTLKETTGMPPCLGWMRYPECPRRELIFAPFSPLPEYEAVRSTPLDDPAHPYAFHIQLPEPLSLPIGGELTEVYAMVQGSGECAVAAATAASRVVRFTLQTLFSRARLGAAFLSLPSNPLGAEMTPCPALDTLFAALAAAGTEGGGEEALVPVLATYFGVPETWVAAMQREFAAVGTHMFADFSYDMKADPEDARHDADRTAAAVAARGCGSDGYSPSRIRVENPHDEAWHLFRTDFDAIRQMVELAQVSSLVPRIKAAAAAQLPGFRFLGSTSYGFDLGKYMRRIDETRGPRTALTIVLDTPERMDEPKREVVKLLQSYCAKARYPVRAVAESDLSYDAATGKLHAYITDASPLVEANTDPTSSATGVTLAPVPAPTGDYEVNFLFHFCPWEEILVEHPESHPALHAAAANGANNDVVFAKPLWSFLVSGLVHRSPAEVAAPDANEVARHQRQPISIKFFDIVRRLFQYALPRQAAETWDQEVSEFKDSCRRIGIARHMPERPTARLVYNSAIVDFAISAMMAHTDAKLVYNEDNTQDRQDEKPSLMMHTFSTAND